MSIKKLALVFVIISIVLIVLLGIRGITQSVPASQHTPVSENDKPTIISTKPEPLENAVVSATETVEIIFNCPLENIGEFKFRIDPKAEIKIELSPDRKTAKIIPQTPYELGVTYTIFIGPESKFDGVGNWGKEAIYHFQTIRFRGI